MNPQGRPGGGVIRIIICLLALGGLISCGLESFYYIDYIPASNYIYETRSTVQLPSSRTDGYGDEQYFTHFVIFYRIYLSDNNPTGRLNDSVVVMNSINNTLTNDYNWSIPYTDITSTTVNTSNLETTFYNRRYYKLELQSVNIDNVLDRNVLGSTLEIRFRDNTGEVPVLSVGGNSYILQRANNAPGILFSPRPTNSRAFLNHPELCDVTNATIDLNADVATNTRGEIRYTYVSMYIIAVGRSYEIPPSTIYSQPTFLGIFKLPEWS
jgi:hypothetical protein